MKTRFVIVFAMLATGLAGCEPQSEKSDAIQETSAPRSVKICDAKPLQKYLGESFSAKLAQRIYAESGTKTLRTGNQKDPVTEDYRTDRLNIFYDDAGIIRIIDCS